MKTNRELKDRALDQLKDNYWWILLATLIVSLIMSALTSTFAGFILIGVVYVAQSYYLLAFTRNQIKPEKLEYLFKNIDKGFVNALVAGLLRTIFVFLWALLFIIPGIIKALAYSQVYHLLADNPDLEPMEALKKSEAMMDGHKSRLFGLYLSFIGWYILCILTFGIGFIFLSPYIQTSVTHFYLDLKGEDKKDKNIWDEKEAEAIPY